MTKACVAARKRYRAKKARGGCAKRGGNVLRNIAALFPRRVSTVRRAATSKGGFFGRIVKAKKRRARGGRLYHKFKKVSKAESRKLAQQEKSRAAARGLLRSNKGGVSRHRRRRT